jgi:hypothetical protein
MCVDWVKQGLLAEFLDVSQKVLDESQEAPDEYNDMKVK